MEGILAGVVVNPQVSSTFTFWPAPLASRSAPPYFGSRNQTSWKKAPLMRHRITRISPWNRLLILAVAAGICSFGYARLASPRDARGLGQDSKIHVDAL